MDIDATIASTSGTSTWSLLYQYSQTAFSQLFSLFNNDWIKGRSSNCGIVVQTKNGPVRGKTFTLLPEGRKVNAFLGIPYASPAERFKKPFPVEPWNMNMLLDCTKFGPRAIQYDMWWDVYLTPIKQDEANCLNINVFTPDWEQSEFKSGRPVMVFVHGGGFLIHSAANYGDWNICQNLCLHDVVVCVVQYRLGLLGFFSTGDERCPGNFGLWDLLAAFKWIKENIAAFGGDPDAITAFGQSAGAAAIDLLSLSPLSKGLFKRVILMGGCASTDWAVVKPKQTQAAAIRLAKRNGWKGADSDLDSLLQYLRTAPVRKLAAPLIGKSAFNRHRKGLEFCPVIDGELIPAPVEQLRKQMDDSLEVIIGGTEFEALLFLALGRSQSNLASLRKYLQIYIPSERLPNAVEMRRRCEEFYLEGVDTNDPLQVSIAFLRLHSDVMINNSVQRYCQGIIGQNRHKIYLYNMIHYNRDEFGFVGLRAPFVSSTHCSDLRYLLGKGLYSKFRPNWDDKHMMHIMGTLFTNFAKYGNPNGQHETSTSTSGKHNAIGNRYLNASGMANGKDNCEDSDLDKEETNLWQPITEDDTYQYFELCLEPKMRSDYQGRRFEFWRNLEFELAIMANGTVK